MKKNAFIVGILLMVLLFSGSHLLAQTPVWMQYSNGDNITAIAEEDGYLWVGTLGGLVRIDKASGNTSFYNIFNSGLPDNVVRAIAIGQDGTKWFGTDAGLTSFDGDTWTTFNKDNSEIPDNVVRHLVAGNDGIVWMAFSFSNYHAVGLASFDGNIWNRYTAYSSFLPSDKITGLAMDNDGLLWITTYDMGVASFDGNVFIKYNTANSGLAGDRVICVTVDNDNTMWFMCANMSWKTYISSFNRSAWFSWDPPGEGSFLNLTVDGSGVKWISGYSGLYSFDGDNWIYYNYENSGLPESQLNFVKSFADNTKWIATVNGLISYNDVEWKTYCTSNCGLPYNGIYDIAVQNDKLLLATIKGLAVFDGTDWEVYDTSNTILPFENFYDIEIGSDGVIWLGSEGFARFDGSEWTIYDTSNSLLDSYILDIEIDKHNTLWLGGGGLYSVEGNNWVKYDTSNSPMPFSRVSSLAIAPDGTKWFSTYDYSLGGAVVALKGAEWRIFNRANSGLPSDTVWEISVENNGMVWFATAAGLAKYNGLDWVTYNSSNSPLPVDNLVSLTADMNGTKWFGYDEDKLFGERMTGFGSFDGINWTISDRTFIPRCFLTDENGVVWMGTFESCGLVAYNPSGSSMSEPEKQPSPAGAIIFPNPASSQINIKTTSPGTFSVFDLNGRLLNHCEEMVNEISFDVSMLPDGIYIIRFTNEQDTNNFKFVKR